MFNVKQSDNVEENTDRLGGFNVFESGYYDATVKMIYGITSAEGAQGVVIDFDLDGKQLRITEYVTKRTGENFYTKDGKDYEMPGWVKVNDLCMFLTEKGILEQTIEEKVVKVYNPDTQQEENKGVPVMVDLLEGNVGLLVQKIKAFKQKKGDNGYYDTDEIREYNNVVKIVHPETKGTVVEYTKGVEPGTHAEAWLERNEGETWDQTKGKAGGAGAGTSNGKRPPATAGSSAPKPATSMFGRK